MMEIYKNRERKFIYVVLLILFVLTSKQATAQQETEARLLRTPSIYGDTIVFSYAGDLWVTKVGARSEARRLTSHPGIEIRPKISPDGKWVAFKGAYDGSDAVYLIPIEGGEPRRLTFETSSPNPLYWTPDGRIAYSSYSGSFNQVQRRLWTVDTNGSLPVPTPVAEISEATLLEDGHTITYTRANYIDSNWRGYRGGRHGRISFYDFAANAYSELPGEGREQYYFPMAVGRSVFYLSDKNLKTINLYRYDLETKRETQLTRFTDADVRWSSTDGKSIVWERAGYLEVYDIASGKVSRQSPRIPGENLQTRPALRQLGDKISALSISPSGNRIAVEARGEIFSVPTKSGDTRNLTQTSGVRETSPAWSPDGKTIAYISDASGNSEVYTQPELDGTAIPLTQENGNMTFTDLKWSPNGKLIELRTVSNDLYILDATSRELTHVVKMSFGGAASDWSPDSRWLAFINYRENGFGSVNLYEIAANRIEKITDGYYSDNAVSFDLNGKYLYLTSSRTFNPGFGRFEYSLKVENTDRIYFIPLAADAVNPLRAPAVEEPQPKPSETVNNSALDSAANVRIDIKNIASRIIPLPIPAGNYSGIYGTINGVIYVSRSPASTITAAKFDLDKRESQTIYSGQNAALSFNQARTQMAMLQSGNLSIINVKTASAPERVETGNVKTVIDPRQEWRQIFWEAWRYARDTFYDPNMRGLDWTTIGQRYGEYLPFVESRADLNYVISLMLLELRTSHTVVQGGDFGTPTPPVTVGQLGADYEIAENHIRFSKIYYGDSFDDERRGPLGEPGNRIETGEYLLEIDGQAVTPQNHPNALLLGKANQFVTLTVNAKPSLDGARRVRVKTIASEAKLRTIEWTNRTRQYVDKMSGGRIGYMYIPNILHEGAAEFIRGFYSQTDKDALIVDERWNSGGYTIQQLLTDTLGRKKSLGLQYRNEIDRTVSDAIEGPKAMLINEYAGSGGDSFPWVFRDSKIGPLIGRTTAGALVGQNGTHALIDGGIIATPEFGVYDRQTNLLAAENIGVEPDIEVDQRPDLVAKKQDPQLDAAIRYLMEQLAKMPPRQPRTEIPRIAPAGRDRN